MILNQRRSRGRRSRCSGAAPALLCAICVLAAAAHVRIASAAQAAVPPTSTAAPEKKHLAHSQRQELYFERRYGIGQLRVHSLAAGDALEFRCQVHDADKAKALNDKRATPVMIERKSGTRLSVLTTQSGGKPPQVTTPETGQEYWMVFGNRGKIVKRGNMVDLVVGTVHMSGLIVE